MLSEHKPTQKIITKELTQKNVTKITYWLNVKILTFSAYLVRYTKVKRKILILCRKVLKRITTYNSTCYNVFKG